MNSIQNKIISSSKSNEKIYSFEGGYISYNPTNLTEKYSSSNAKITDRK